jgi:outer membrane protein OmpA-like peptidoglycan-associated protein
MKKEIFLLSLLLGANSLVADEKKELFAIRPEIIISPIFNSSSFESLADKLNCGQFDPKSSFMFGFGIGSEFQINPKSTLDFTISYHLFDSKFESERNAIGYDSKSAKETVVSSKNEIKSKIHFLTLTPSYKYEIVRNFINGPLSLKGGLGIAIPISSNFTQSESIVSPQNAYFINQGKKTNSRDLYDGEINSLTTPVISLNAGVENRLKIGEKLDFTQYLGINYTLNNYVSSGDWKSLGVNLALGLRYSFTEAEKIVEEKPIPKPEPIKPVEAPKPMLALKIKSIDKASIVKGKELAATQPLVNAIFFKQNSDKIENIVLNANSNSIDYNKIDPVAAHKFSLVRIADLLKSNPKAQAHIVGSSSGADNEANPEKLAENRAKNVAEALIGLGVPADKIKTNWSVAPANPSNQEYKEGVEENQRVDIQLKNAFLQEYVYQDNYSEFNASMTLAYDAENLKSVGKIPIRITGIDTTVYADKKGEYIVEFRNKRISESQNEINFEAIAEADGIKASDNEKVNIEPSQVKIGSLMLKNFKAYIRFDYNSSKLSDDNKELLKQLVKILPAGAKIKALGSADQVGSEASNIKLENARAEAAKDFIRSVDPNVVIETGVNKNKVNDNTPVGRFLNRSIIITIE